MIESPTTASTTTRRRRWLAPLAVVVLAAAGLGIGLAVANNDHSTDASTAAQIANVQQACQNWMGNPTRTGVEVSGDWCSGMGGWMTQQAAAGHMGGSMMWGSRDRMLETCRRWANTTAGSTTNARSCDDMVSWMNDHMGADWGHWTMRGSMMGR